MISPSHKAGFVNIIGKPNVGKSTLMNILVGERLSIVSSKAQTTRHRILGLINTDEYQIVFSDTPGMLKPKYELHKSMMGFVHLTLEDADVIVFVTDLFESEEEIEDVIQKINASGAPILIVERLPVHPPFYDKEELTDRPERFFASEIIREKIFTNYKKEIPYSTEVGIEDFHEEEKLIRIRATIFVERDSQKGIVIGDKGKMLKKVGTEARADLEKFFGKKIFLETFVKVEQDWRKNKLVLKKFGYDPS